jgi:ankyrin repeat protein
VAVVSIRRIEDALRNGANQIPEMLQITALMLAARWGYLEIVVLLLKEGANPNIVNGGEIQHCHGQNWGLMKE